MSIFAFFGYSASCGGSILYIYFFSPQKSEREKQISLKILKCYFLYLEINKASNCFGEGHESL